MTLVSVVVSTYNGAKYLSTQLDSVINQTYSPLEIIVVDDASSDNTASILESYKKTNSNIKVHLFDNNVGYIKNFERGITLAKGDYIALCDQDDWWHPEKIERLVNTIGDADLVYCDSQFVDSNLNPLGDNFSDKKNLVSSNNPLHFTIENCVSGHACLFKTSLLKHAFPFPDLVPHDWWVTFLASCYNGVSYYDDALVKYRIHDSNVIVNNTKKNKVKRRAERKARIHAFYNACPEQNVAKNILNRINNSYQSFNLSNNLSRVIVFFKHRNALLKLLNKSALKRVSFALSMFTKLK